MKTASGLLVASLILVGFRCDQQPDEARAAGRGPSGRSLPTLSILEGDPVETLLPPDAIPAIDSPQFVPADRAGFMRPDEPVVGLLVDGVAKAYSTWYLDHHEIVNDVISNRAIAVTW